MDYLTKDLKLAVNGVPETSYEKFCREISFRVASSLLERVFGSTMTEKKRTSFILREAERLTFGDRNDAYGHPLDDFSKTAKMITGILLPKLKPGEEVTAEEFSLIMVAVKISRLLQTPDHLDSMVDGPGYFNTYWMVRERRRQEAGLSPIAPEFKETLPSQSPEVPATTRQYSSDAPGRSESDG